MAGPMSPDAPKTTIAEDLRELMRCPRELWLVYLATFFEYIGVFSFMQTLPLWLSADFGMNDKEAGWWATIYSTLVTLFVMLVGGIADAVGVRRTLILSFCLTALMRLGMSLAPTAPLALTALMAFGVAFATTSPVLQTAVQRTSTPRTRAFAFTLWYVSFNVAGAVVGPMIDAVRKGFLVPDLAHPGKTILRPRSIDLPILGPKTMSAHAAILGLGFIAAFAAALVTLTLRKNFEHQGDAPAVQPAAADANAKAASGLGVVGRVLRGMVNNIREVYSDKAFWRFMLMLALLALVRMMFQHMHFTWPKYVTRMEGEDFPVGTVWSINSALIIVLAPLGAALTRNYKPINVLLVGAMISSLSPFVLCFGSTFWFQIGMILVLTVGEALWSPRLYEYNVSIAPRGREATYVSLAALPTFLAKFLVGPTSGYLLATYVPVDGPRNPAMLWGIIGISTVIGPLMILRLRHWIAPKTADTASNA